MKNNIILQKVILLAIASLIFSLSAWGKPVPVLKQAPSPAVAPAPTAKKQAAKPRPENYRYGRNLSVAVPPIVTLDSQLATDFSSQLVINNIQEGLFAFNQKLELIPVLASSPPQMENDISYLISLRKGILFHDNTEFDAQSVVFTVERLLNPATGAPLHAYFASQLKGAEVVDKHTVRIKLAQPYIDVAALFSRIELYPLSSKAVAASGAEYGKVTATGTGPFLFFELSRDENLVLKRFELYWQTEASLTAKSKGSSQKHLPYLNKLQFKFRPSEEIALKSLYECRTSAMGEISVATAKRINSKYIKVVAQPGMLLQQIYLNLNQKPFDNKLVRQAMAYALDRQAIVNAVFKGYANTAKSCFPAWHWAHDPVYKGIDYNPQTAQELLQQAGYTVDNPLRFELLCTNEPILLNQAKWAAKQWKELGIQVKVIPLSKEDLMTRLYEKRVGKPSFAAVMEDWQGYVNPEMFSESLYSSTSPYNKVSYNNPILDKLLADARAAQLQSEKSVFYRQAEQIITDDASTIYLAFPQSIWAYNHYVNGLQLDYRGLVCFSRVWVNG